MAVSEVGQGRLSIIPDAREFKARLEADLARISSKYNVRVGADVSAAKRDLEEWRAAQEARAVKIRAEVDRKRLRQAIKDVEKDFDQLGSSIGRSLKTGIATAGIEMMPSLAAGLASVAQALQQVSAAGLAVPGILAGIGASVGTLALGLSGVKDAWDASEKASSVSGASQAAAAAQAMSATNALRNAKVDEANAQKDVAQAYRDARQQLEDLNIEQRSGVLSEREAILEAAKARRDLATGRFKDSLDYESAQLRVEEADQRVVQARQRNIELGDKVADANAKGVTGSDRVVAANERLVRSQQSLQQAAAAAATAGHSGGADKAAEAMAKLAPNAREFVQTLIDMKPAFTQLRTTVQQNLFAGLSAEIRKLVNSDMPNLEAGMGSLSSSMNRNFRQLFTSLGSDGSKGLLDRILGNTTDAQGRMRASIDPLVHAMGVLTAAGSDGLPRLANALTDLATRFDRFVSAADADGRLEAWISDGLTGLTHLGDTIINLGSSFNAVSRALGGEGLLAHLDHATKKMADFLNSAEGQKKLTELFREGRETLEKWRPIISDIAHSLPAVFQGAATAAEIFRPILKEITGYLKDHPETIRAIVAAFLLWNTVLSPITKVAGAIGGLTDAYKALKLMIIGTGEAAAVANGTMGASGAAAGVGGAAGRFGKFGGALGALGPLGVLAGGGLAIEQYAEGEDARTDEWKRKRAAAKTPAEKEAVDKDFFGNKYIPPEKRQTGAAGSVPDQAAWEVLAKQGNAVAKWITEAKDPGDMAKRIEWFKAHQDQDKPGFKPPLQYADGGPTPSSKGPGPTGGFLAEVHDGEYVISKRGRSRVPDSFLHALNQGMIDGNGLPRFDVGGPVDEQNLNPQQLAPNPTAGGSGMLNSILGGVASGVGGPLGGILGMATGMSGGGGGSTAGIWGLAKAGGDPNAMQAWGQQTSSWLSNFASSTLMSGGQAVLSGVLGGLGLGGSILSPNNVYNQALQKTIGFYTGEDSPFGGGGSAQGMDGGAGMQTVTMGDGSQIQIPTFGTSQGVAGGLPAGAMNPDGTLSDAAQRAIQYAQAHAVGQKYVYGGIGGEKNGYDCSGIASAIYAAAKGLPQNQRYFTTESDFTALGFVPGYSKGDLNIGVMRGGGGPNSHMVLTLPNGINVESGGASDTTMYGGNAKGAQDLPLHWHLALSGNQGVGAVPGLYDDGGYIPTGLSLVNNKSGVPEPVITNSQSEALKTVAKHIDSQPGGPSAQHLTPQPSPAGDGQIAAPQPTPSPTPPPVAQPEAPPTESAGGPAPSLSPQQLSTAPSDQNHNLKALNTGIDSGAAAIGNAASAAISMGMGGMGGGGAGEMVAGLIKQGGMIVKNISNVVSSAMVGNITGGTSDLAYGRTAMAPQNNPKLAATPQNVVWNIQGNYELRSAMEQAELKQAQDYQAQLSTHRRV